MPDASLSAFMKDLPVIPENLITDVPQMLATLQSRGYLKTITFQDVLKELNARPLSTEEMIACLKWWVKIRTEYHDGRQPLAQIQRTLVNAAVLSTGDSDKNGGLLQLSSIQTYVTSKSIIPVDGPLPAHVLPLSIAREFDSRVLETVFNWSHISMVGWLTFICSISANSDPEHDLTVNAQWAERVIGVLARGWPSLPGPDKEKVVALLKDKSCIPTSSGMKTPDQAYFASVNIFKDLPTVILPSGNTVRGAMERVLEAIGVRKHVELQVLFNRSVVIRC